MRFCLVARFLAACFLTEAFPCALRFAEIVFDFARVALLAVGFFLFAADADFDLAWLCVLDDLFFDGGATWVADARALRAFGVALRAFRWARDEEDAFVAGIFFSLFVVVRCVIGGLRLSSCFPVRAFRLTPVFHRGQLRVGRA